MKIRPKSFWFIIVCWSATFAAFAQDSQSYLDTGKELYYSGDYEKAILHFEMGIQYRDVLIFYHYYWIGSCYVNLSEHDKAMTAYDIALKIDEKNPYHNEIRGKSHWNKGLLYGKIAQVQKGIKEYKIALKYYPDDSSLHSNLGFDYIKLDSFDIGLDYLSRAIELNQKNAYGYNNRAWVFIKLKQYDKAKEDLDRSKSLRERNPYLYRNYALYYIGIDDLDNACLNLKKAEKQGYKRMADKDEKNDVENLIKEHCLDLGIKQ